MMREVLGFVASHGYLVLFLWVLAEQGAFPIPSVPLLLAAGALIRSSLLHPVAAVACCMAAALLVDSVWFYIGRSRGPRVLRLLCRLSIEPDSCVRQTENAFLRYGLKSLLISKFVPGLNAVAAPMAGNSGAGIGRFLAYDALGTAIWSASYMSLGYVLSDQLEKAAEYASRTGSGLLLLVLGLFAAWIVWKILRRRAFLRKIEIARISAEELRQRLDAGEDLFIVDLRSDLTESAAGIPGALRIGSEELVSRHQEIPRDREIILFCS
ncbi:MAG: VTT domain-containing protein [Bryobacterales bacterium]|nr:VTT domain-containing protein [Bryobacterales bacterium]